MARSSTMARPYQWWALFAVIAIAAFQQGSIGLGLIDIGLIGIYEAWLVPTSCGVETRAGRPCANRARGRLRGCRRVPSHGKVKRDVLLGLLRGSQAAPAEATPRWRRAPAARGAGGSTATAAPPAKDQPLPASEQPRQFISRANFVMSVLCTVCAVVGVVLSYLQYAQPSG